jgi:sugar/nucleoside kinase (ribokinase family)
MRVSPPPRRLVSHGSILVDLALEVPHLPARGGDVLAGRSLISIGGGFNLLSAAARLGLPGVYAGPHGTGPFGDRVRAALAAEGLELVQPADPALDTGYCVVLIEPDGERTFATAAGADARVDPRRLREVAYQDGDAVYISGYDLAYPFAGSAIAEHGGALPPAMLLVFDPGPLAAEIAPERLAPVLSRADLVSLNAREAELLGGADRVLAACRRSAALILRSGASGASILRSGAPPVPVPAVETRIVDTTGAGDVHVGATLAGLARGLSLEDSVLLANRAAAYAVSTLGPAAGPTPGQLEKFGAGRW